MPRCTDLEVKRGNEWKKVQAADVAGTEERHGRCIECHEPVTAHKRSVDGRAAHPEHRKENPAREAARFAVADD